MKIIAADIGGTKSHLIQVDSDQPQHIIFESKYRSTDFENFESLLGSFIRDANQQKKTIDVLSLALPGVITDEVAQLTNLPWKINSSTLKQTFAVEHVYFMNDFQASALGTLQLSKQDFSVLNRGRQNNNAPRVIAGAGTGLGVSWLLNEGSKPVAYSTEAGHVDFAPVDAEQIKLLQFLMKRYPHVSCERILSGDGLVNLYNFFSGCTINTVDENNIDAQWVNQQTTQGNATAKQAVRLFVRIYAAYVGNLALMFKPEGGIYITGGIAVKIINWMQSEDFIQAYLNKGRMQQVVEQVAVFLVNNESVGVFGALSAAVKLLQDEQDDH
jgi:glucokinase